jgi:RimJ/RimL family protein N-acetyltransferase
MLADPLVQQYTMVPTPIPQGFEREWLQRYEDGRADGTREAFAIVDEDNEFLGLALAFAIDREGRELELGYTLKPEARGRGAATWAVRELTEWAIRELDPLRIQLQISADNVASKGVAERAGYVYEGTLRSVHFKQGIRQDMEVWSRVEGDPPPPSN